MNSGVIEQFGPQQPQLSDDQLLAEARCGDGRAFGLLCQRYSAMLSRKISSIVRHREDTEDVLQETLLSAYQHLHTFRGTCRFSSWIVKIGINMSLVMLRKRKTLSRIASAGIEDDSQTFQMWEFRDPRPNPEQCYIADQTLLGLRKAIQGLPPKMRNVMDLYYTKELRLRDAAASTLDITEQNAKSRMLRARRMLRRSLRNQWNPFEVTTNASKNLRRHRDCAALVESECSSPLGH